MEQFALLRDFALIMVVAGVVTLVLRKLHQPPILGYLIAGLFISPYFVPFYSVSDMSTIGMLADIGMVLILFGVGLEFGWSKIRQIGITALIIGGIEILTMISLGYGLGRVMGWSRMDALFLGAALHTSSSAIIVKVLKDMGKLNLVSSRTIVGILVIEDFAAVIILALLSGVNTPGISISGYIPSLVFKLVIFVASSLVLGAVLVPRIIAFTERFHSRETLLIVSLALCFALALLSKELGLSVATGAFLMGALIGDAPNADAIVEVTAPVRDMFAAIFFVAIGMLIDISRFKDFLLPALIVAVVFISGKILSNFFASILTGFSAKESFQVGMGMPQMGEFSLAIAKAGVDSKVTVAPLYPVITLATSLTTVVAPYFVRSADKVSDFFARRSPHLMREYVTHMNDWGQTIRQLFSRQNEESHKFKRQVRSLMINFLILVVIIGLGTLAIQYVESLARVLTIRLDILALLLGSFVLVLCLPSIILIWRNLTTLIDEITRQLLAHSARARIWKSERLNRVLRYSIVFVLAIIILLWMIPIILQLLFIGSLALAMPAFILAVLIFLVTRSIRGVHQQLERTFSKVFLGDSQVSPGNTEFVRVSNPGLIKRLLRRLKRIFKLRKSSRNPPKVDPPSNQR
jgi:monovalent cation:H+ antiporter-2, CPA2 family